MFVTFRGVLLGGLLCTLLLSSSAYASVVKHKGINITLDSIIEKDDLVKIQNSGANLIRLVVHADSTNKKAIFDGYDSITVTSKEKIRSFLDSADDLGLSVIVDMHSWPCKKNKEFWISTTCQQRYINSWVNLASLTSIHKSVIGFDLMNEPDLLKKLLSKMDFNWIQYQGDWAYPTEWKGGVKDYFKLMTDVSNAIYEIAPTKTVYIEGVGVWGKPYNFRWMEPIKAKQNVCYSFHMYYPNAFTDQGKVRRGGGRVIYPSITMNKKKIEEYMSDVLDFQKKYNTCIFVGEFGLTASAEGNGAKEWMDDVIGLFEKYNWSWAYWSYSIRIRNPYVCKVNGEYIYCESERLQVLNKYWNIAYE